ncbi:Cytochrome P450 [Sesbania bispinosa]|nr:Cytochrome P450 [Sesbania bispinosa]
MELHLLSVCVTTLLACYIFVVKFLRRLNGWYYDLKLRNKQYPLPPGDMGWPLIGNLLAFMKDFSSGHPNSFINNLVLKYGQTGIYKTHLYGNPSIIICESQMCRRVLTDDVNFKNGNPKSVKRLVRIRSSIDDVSSAEPRRFRRLVIAPLMGHNALAMYLERIENIMVNSLEELSSMKHSVEFLKEMKKISFKVIMHVFMGRSYNEHIITKIGSSFTNIYNGLFSIPINVPGFTFRKALKARQKLIMLVQPVVDERRLMIKNGQVGEKKDLVDNLLEIEDENGQKLEDEDIIDILIAFLFAGHESTSMVLMWSITYLTQHPHFLKKAKEEQEEIIKTRLPSQKQLTLNEIKQMVYLSQVIDETLRCTNIAFGTFREATTDVNINGYIIPKGWRVIVWLRAIHMNPEYHPNPEEFNPSRWDDYNAKARTFLPFGAGSRLFPGSDLAKLETSVFLHYFLLNYKLVLFCYHPF